MDNMTQPEAEANTKVVRAFIDPDLKLRFKIAVLKAQSTEQDTIEEFIREYCDRCERREAAPAA